MTAPKPLELIACSDTTRALRDVRELKPNERHMLALIANMQGEGFSQALLAERSGYSLRQVGTIIRTLTDKGVLVRQRRGGSGGGRLADTCRIEWANVPQAKTADRGNVQCEEIADCRLPIADCLASKNSSENNQKRGATSPAPRACGLDNLLPLVDISPSEPKGSSGEDSCPKPKKFGADDARRLWAALRPTLSASGRNRAKPALIDKSLPPIIAKFGYDATLAAAKRFYSENPECTRSNGDYQPGLQVICNDGRLADWITRHDDPPGGEPAFDQEAELAAARERYEAHKRSKQQQQAALPL